MDGTPNEKDERDAEATDPRTLDELEDQGKARRPDDNSPTLSPDEGSDRASDDDAGQPM